MNVDEKINSLGINLPEIGSPMGNFLPCIRTGNLLYISGQIPFDSSGKPVTGVVGDNVSSEEAYKYARLAGLYILSVAQAYLNSLDRIRKIVKINGYVNCIVGFTDQPAVINGCSDLFVELWGDNGKHARAAIGVSGLPAGVPVEIEAIFEIGGQ
jgi:enamine deaminase RidA (YjgF/YER057c/UK114 family)